MFAFKHTVHLHVQTFLVKITVLHKTRRVATNVAVRDPKQNVASPYSDIHNHFNTRDFIYTGFEYLRIVAYKNA
jgi:hypothetical protein